MTETSGFPVTAAFQLPGVTVERVKEATGWPLKVASDLEVTPPPTPADLAALRDLHARTAAAHGLAPGAE